MIEWIEVLGSSRITAMAYDEVAAVIYVRFPNGVQWWYGGCPEHIWEEFSHPQTSKGQYIHNYLDAHANGPYVG